MSNITLSQVSKLLIQNPQLCTKLLKSHFDDDMINLIIELLYKQSNLIYCTTSNITSLMNYFSGELCSILDSATALMEIMVSDDIHNSDYYQFVNFVALFNGNVNLSHINSVIDFQCGHVIVDGDIGYGQLPISGYLNSLRYTPNVCESYGRININVNVDTLYTSIPRYPVFINNTQTVNQFAVDVDCTYEYDINTYLEHINQMSTYNPIIFVGRNHNTLNNIKIFNRKIGANHIYIYK